ncbi:hypothetical protein EYM_03015 [Ignicoccus islandicus DSM 13165]|uniref:Uncharacterized protein n=1 Tax=Ignicoccus islandicus DSM 13165 TaxID=940295 RepID=A0A0U3E3A3_9CREN|nr:hypothetical protein EYM_03015 [Ignicoccus islandicus DSM 13165]
MTYVLYNDEGEPVCPTCGSVLSPAFGFVHDIGIEGKYDVFEPYSKSGEGRISSRATLSDSVHDGGLGTVINPREAKGSKFKLFKKLSKEQEKSRIRNNKESIEVDVMKTLNVFLDNVSSDVNIPDSVRKEISKVAKKIVNDNYESFKGISRKDRNHLAYAIALMILEARGVVPEAKSFLRKFFNDEKEINKIIDWLKRVKYDYGREIYMKMVNPRNREEEYLAKGRSTLQYVIQQLKLDYKPEERPILHSFYEDLIRNALSMNMNSGKQKLSLLGGLVYIVLNVFSKSEKSKVTQSRLAKLLNVGNNSIRETYVEANDRLLIVVSVPTRKRK